MVSDFWGIIMKSGLLLLAALLAAPVVANPLPTSRANELLYNFNAPVLSVSQGFRFIFDADTAPGSVWYDVYGDADGQNLIATIQAPAASYYSAWNGDQVLDFSPNDPAYDALNDGVFSVGLWQTVGAADVLGGYAKGLYCSALGCTYSFGEPGMPVIRQAPAPAPEPASWGMMVAGFGLIATAMRRGKGTRATV